MARTCKLIACVYTCMQAIQPLNCMCSALLSAIIHTEGGASGCIPGRRTERAYGVTLECEPNKGPVGAQHRTAQRAGAWRAHAPY
jgi:hypothetical protein